MSKMSNEFLTACENRTFRHHSDTEIEVKLDLE